MEYRQSDSTTYEFRARLSMGTGSNTTTGALDDKSYDIACQEDASIYVQTGISSGLVQKAGDNLLHQRWLSRLYPCPSLLMILPSMMKLAAINLDIVPQSQHSGNNTRDVGIRCG